MNRIYKSYYTKCDFITEYMVKSIDIKDSDKILEPSAGDGVFIDKILEENNNVNIYGYDLNPDAIKILNDKYNGYRNIVIKNTNTLLDEELDDLINTDNGFDKVIGNPPYGGWIDYEMRDVYKDKYKMNGKETYTLFLSRCISVLKERGTLSFIIPDTYLFLRTHKDIRRRILSETKIKEILVFPSKLFPGVKFGYSNLSIITLQKCSNKEAMENNFRVITNINTTEDINKVINNNLESLDVKELNQKDIFSNDDSIVLIKGKDYLFDLINNCEIKLGDMADCVTGIYTGNNKEFMKVKDESIKNSKGYEIITEEDLFNETLDSIDELLKGIDGEQCYIPIVKGASHQKYLRVSNDWYVKWDKYSIHEYNTRKKARFQNSQFYFKKGIAVPMVKSSKLSATIMEGMVFDQSIVGVFPKDEKYFNYLLALLNSKIGREIINIVNPSANNSANYLKKIPIIIPEDCVLENINILVKNLIINLKDNEIYNYELEQEINDCIEDIFINN